MKILADSCLSLHAVTHLRNAGHDVVYVGEWNADPGDIAILQIAQREHRTLVTIDKDFGELLIVQGHARTSVIRLVGFRAQSQGRAIAQLLASYVTDLEHGALITAEPWRVRIRTLQPLARDDDPSHSTS